MTTFSALGLSEPLLRAIADQGFENPTPIQNKAIPALLRGEDVTGMAQTGGGKTAAFVLPMLQMITDEKLRFESNRPIGVILAPTRELASQIGDTIRMLARHTDVRHVVISGGSPFKPQINALQRGVHILVATPGRLQDHVRRGNVKFSHTRFFMLDEADRMLDMGFIDEVKDIAKKLPEKHQTVLFSATMHKSIRKLSESLQNNPVRVEVERDAGVANTIEHRVMHVTRADKVDVLTYLQDKEQPGRSLVFTRTKRDADKLTQILDKMGYLVDALHGDKPQRKRQQILNSFKNGKINILVATDVAARGIDVKGIGLVVNYDMPLESENYIHRVGRTGRAGEQGLAISFCSPGDMRLLIGIQHLLKQQIEVDTDHAWHHAPGKSRHKNKDFGGHKPSHSRYKPNEHHAPAKRRFKPRANQDRDNFAKKKSWDGAKSQDRQDRDDFKKRDDSSSRDGFKKRGEFKKRDDSSSREGFKKRGEFKKRDDFKKPYRKEEPKVSDAEALQNLLDGNETGRKTSKRRSEKRAARRENRSNDGAGNRDNRSDNPNDRRPKKSKKSNAQKGKVKNKGRSRKLARRATAGKGSSEGGFAPVKRRG